MTNSKRTLSKTAPTVKLYKQGVQLNRPVQAQKPMCLEDTRRGVIAGWSKASRRRMREFLLLNAAPQGWATYGPTFTIPGDTLPVREAKRLWERFSLQVCKRGWGMVWRLELQQRGQYHWHALIIQQTPHPADITLLWWDALHTLGKLKEYTTKSGFTVYDCYRESLPGASDSACNIGEKGDKGSWLRYLQDHCSKAKQEQIPENVGRHWGVVGRKCFAENKEIASVEMDDRQYLRLVRCMNRLATPSYPNPCDPFGRSLSWTPTRGRRGKVVVFCNPLTIARLVKWTQSTPFCPSRVHLETRAANYQIETRKPRILDIQAKTRHQQSAIPTLHQDTVSLAMATFGSHQVSIEARG